MLEIDEKKFWKFISEKISPQNCSHQIANEKESLAKLYLTFIAILESRQKVTTNSKY